jgi:hypothetical protein
MSHWQLVDYRSPFGSVGVSIATDSTNAPLPMHYWNGTAWIGMTGTIYPQADTTETVACGVCKTSVQMHPEGDLPNDWRETALPCSMFFACGACIASYGTWSALRRNAEDIHRERGGCAGCKA